MKKQWKKGLLALLCGTIAVTAGGFAACTDGSAPPPSGGPGQEQPSEPEVLFAPIVGVGEGKAVWTAVLHATGYSYKIDNGEEEFTTELTVSLEEGQSIQVKAVGDGESYLDSDWSSVATLVVFKIYEPELTLTGGRVSWEAVENAVGYAYVIDGGEEVYTEELYVDLQDGESVKVKAVAGGYPYKDSDYSDSAYYEKIAVTVAAGTGGTATGTGRYDMGEKATITAIPDTGYRFVAWSDGDTNPSREITVTSSATYEAIFSLEEYVVLLTCDILHGSVDGNGTYEYGTVVTIAAIANTGYHFVRWSDGNTDATREITMTGDVDLTAEFAINVYTVTATAENGSVSGVGDYEHGEVAALTATPDEGYHFVRWSDGNTDATREITMTSDIDLTAEFAINVYTVTATAENGSVSGVGDYEHGEVATLTAIPDEGYHFVCWSDGNTDATREITVTDGISLTATFEINTYTVTLISSNTAMGTVTGAATYNHGDVAVIKAIPTDEKYKFVSWSDGIDLPIRNITVTSSMTLTATFADQTYTIAVNKTPAGVGTITGAGTIKYGESATLTATTTNSDYLFKGWYDGDDLLGTDTSYTVSNVKADINLTAVWELRAVVLTLASDFDIAGTLEGAGTYKVNEVVQMMATPNNKYTFLGWYDEGGTLLSSSPSFPYKLSEDKMITARWQDDWKEEMGYSYWTFDQLGNDVMPIVGFNSPNASTADMAPDIVEAYGNMPSQINDTNYQILKDSGVNTIIGWWNDYTNGNLRDDIMQELDLAEKYGIVYIVSDRDAMYTNNVSDLANFSAYMDKPAYGGTILIDEPGAVNFADIGEATAAWKSSKYSNTLAYVNMLPNYAADWQLEDCQKTGGTYTGEAYKNYEEWIQRFLTYSKPQVFSYDHYPYLFTQPDFFRDGWYTNLSNVRYWTMKANVPYWVYGQLGGWPEYGQVIDPTTKHLTYGHTALQFNSMLSYGAKGIQYYNYFMPPNYVNAGNYTSATMVDGTPTPYYAQIQKINKQVAAIDDVLLRCAWKGIIQIGISPATIPDGDKVPSYGALSTYSGSGNAIVGCFEYRDIGWAYYVTTNDVYNASSVTLNFNGNYNLRKVQDGVSSTVSANSITLDIPAGEGVLVVVPKN